MLFGDSLNVYNRPQVMGSVFNVGRRSQTYLQSVRCIGGRSKGVAKKALACIKVKLEQIGDGVERAAL